MWILNNLSDRARSIIGTGLFIVACMIPLFAVWRYTGYGLTAKSYRISDAVYHWLIIGDVIIFYIQWKVYPFTWNWIRYWFSNHVWSIMFVLVVICIIQSLLVIRLYPRSYRRYSLLYDKIWSADYTIDQVDDKIELLSENIGEVLENQKNIKRLIDDLSYAIERQNKNQTNSRSTTPFGRLY